MVDQTASSGSSGAGQQDPSTSNSEHSIALFRIRQMLARMETMKLVKVTAVTGGGGAIARAGTVNVQLLVSQLDGAANATPHGVVNGIPWWRLQGGTSGIICDPVVGDIGYVICADRDISNVKAAVTANKSPQTPPGSFRKFSISDGIYVGGCLNDVMKQYIAFTPQGIVWTDAAGNVLKSTSAGFEMTPAGGVFKVNGSIEATGEVTAKFGTGAFVTLSQHRTASLNITPPIPGT
jgi:hypothetical protein